MRRWAELVLYVLGKEVYFREPETEAVIGVLSGQYTLVRLSRIMSDVEHPAQKLRQRSADQLGRVERNRYVVHNAWVVAGTRIPTRAVWRFREAGYTAEAIIRKYPLLTRRDVEAALQYAKRA